MKKIVILCAGDFGKEVAWLIEDINRQKPFYDLIGFLDDDPGKTGQFYNGVRCLGSVDMLMDLNTNDSVSAVIANQSARIRKNIVKKLGDFSAWETIVHPSVNLSGTSKLGKGCIVCANCNISVNSRLGDQCIWNLGVTVGHDCNVGDYVSLMSGAVISGHVSIGEGAYFGSNCTVVPGRKIGSYATVGAGSVVIRNVKDDASVMGVPAKVLGL